MKLLIIFHTKYPIYLFEKEDMKKLKDDQILGEAEDVLNLNLFGHQFEGK